MNHSFKPSLVHKFLILSILILILTVPVSAKVFVANPSNGIITAPAASITGSQLIFSNKTPSQAVLNHVKNQSIVVVGDISLSGEKIQARASHLSKYWKKSDTVVLGTGFDVSAALVAIKYNAPILICNNTMPQATKDELNRLKPKKIIICASPSSIPDSVLNPYKNFQKQRFWYGSDEKTLEKIQGSKKKIYAPKTLLPVTMVAWKDGGFDFDKNVTVNFNAGISSNTNNTTGNTKRIIWSSDTIITSIAINRYAKGDLPVIYITCDNLMSKNEDIAMLNKIKSTISGSANVIIDPSSPKPGEAPRAVKNAPSGIAVYIAAACPGVMYDLVNGVNNGYLRESAGKLDGIVYINYGSLNLEKLEYMSRSWDDNFSKERFAGLYKPSKFLQSGGIKFIQPKVGTNTEAERIMKISSALINIVYSAKKEHLNGKIDSNLVAEHEINPTELAFDAQRILNNKTPTIGTSNWIYLASQYIGGYPIKKTQNSFSNAASSGTSTYSGKLSRTEYRDIAKRVFEYMKNNKKVPDTVNVKGGKLNSSDVTYLFAKIISNHTNKKNMTLPSSVSINESPNPVEAVVKFIRGFLNF